MKSKVYIETTIVSYLAARPSRDLIVAAHQQLTSEWWMKQRSEFNVFTSEFVFREASAGDELVAHKRLDLLAEIPVLSINEPALSLAGDLVRRRIVPQIYAEDASHIAICNGARHGLPVDLELQAHCQCSNPEKYSHSRPRCRI